MSKVCAVCGKKQQTGHKVSHSNSKSNRVFKPNLQSIKTLQGGSTKRALVCTRCIRSGSVTKAV